MKTHTFTYMRHRVPTTLVSVDGKDIGFFTERTDRLRNGDYVRVYSARLGLPGHAGPAIDIFTRDAAIAWLIREATEEHRI